MRTFPVLLLCLLCPWSLPWAVAQSPTAFTYQGTLLLDDRGVDGELSFKFSLWDAPAGGDQVGQTITQDDVEVMLGRLSVELDFGAAAFDGDPRWLEIVITDDGSGGTADLEPRQKITPTPYALRSLTGGGSNSTTDVVSNLPTGSSFSVSLNGLPTGTALTLAEPLTMNQAFNATTATYASAPQAAPLRLRRLLGADTSWRSAALNGQAGIDVVLQLNLPGGNVQWQIANASASGWGLPVGDDGLPLESLELSFAATSFNRVVNGSFAATVPPSLGLDRGFSSGFAPGDSYRFVVDGNSLADYRITSDVFEQPGSGARITLRQNPSANPALVDWFFSQLVRSFELEVTSAALGTLIPSADGQAGATQYTLRLADDGLPIEEIEINY